MNIPIIKRAKGFRLYTENGTRIIDLYRENGKAFMGHRAGKLSLNLKNAINKGVLSCYPSPYLDRFKKSLKTVFPEYNHFYIVENCDIAVEVKPFYPKNCEHKIIAPVLPFPGSFSPKIICSKEVLDIQEVALSSVIIEAANRNMHDYIAFEKSFKPEMIMQIDSPIFAQNGPYLKFTGNSETYPKVWQKALENGILLPLDPTIEAILPFEFSEGEEVNIKKSLGVL